MPMRPSSPPTAVLLISPEPWEAHSVSKHHYARTLARLGRSVLFVDPPDPSLRQLRLIPIPDEPGIRLVQGPSLIPGLRFLPAPLRSWLERRWLQRLEWLAGTKISAVWLFENSRFYDLRFADDRLRIYHQVDLNQNFHPALAARTADICFCTTELIRQQLAPHHQSVYRLHHGLAPVYESLQLNSIQRQRLATPGVHAVYIGNLDMAYLDHDLLVSLIQAHPEVQFHLVGACSPDNGLMKQLTSSQNVHWWGKVPSSLILECIDLQLVCYQASHHADQASPHKFMEYLASGRTVLATYTAEYSQYADLLAMSENGSNAGYMALFESVLQRLDQWNSPQRMAARQAFAADHTYERQLQKIEAHLAAESLPSLLAAI